MALTEKMIEKAREMLASNRGRYSQFDHETIVRAYLEHGTVAKAAESLGMQVQSFHYRLKKALKDAKG